MAADRAMASDTGRAVPGHRSAEVREVAAALFAVHGYSATTMTDIANATGVFPGSLYHHFRSKEEIALAILDHFDQELNSLSGTLATSDADADPEERIRHLVRDVVALSMRNGASIRLRVFEPPTVATARLDEARAVQAPALERAWKAGIGAIAESAPGRLRNAALLRFAFKNLTLDAGAHFPAHSDPSKIADTLSETLLYGLTPECPDDAELDRSEALRAAMEAIASWRPAASTDADVRTQILAAARTLFSRRGYDATTIRDIAAAAGVRMATLYRRVESKEAILAEVIEEFSTSIDTATRAALTTGRSEVESLDALAAVFVHARRRFREESNILRFGSAKDGSVACLATYARETDKRLVLLEGVLDRGMRRRTIRRFDTPHAIAPHVRYTLWVPYQDFGRTSVSRAHQFLRDTLLRGFMNL
jgi:AcrR family transcriptional regulator